MPFTGVKPLTEDPAGYDPSNKYRDPVKYYQHKEALVAAEQVKMAEAKLMQQELAIISDQMRENRSRLAQELEKIKHLEFDKMAQEQIINEFQRFESEMVRRERLCIQKFRH